MKVLLKGASVGPGLVASTLLMCLVIGPLLPAWAQTGAMLGGPLVAVLLMCGVGESGAVRLLYSARRMSTAERRGLAAVMAALQDLGVGPPAGNFYVDRRADAPAAIAHGRRSIVISPLLVAGVLSGQLPRHEAVAVLGHAATVAGMGLARQDPFIEFWSIPCRMLSRVGRPLRGLLGAAWKVRAIVFSVAIWQSLTDGPQIQGPLSASMLTLILGMSYATPLCSKAWDEHLARTADIQLVDMGLGSSMARFLRRYDPTPAISDRLQLLDPPPNALHSFSL